jgi:hypothetical protein
MLSPSLLSIAKVYWDREIPLLPAQVGLERTLIETKPDLYGYYLDRIEHTQNAFFPFYTPLVSKDWPVDEKDVVPVHRIFIDLDVRIDPKTGKKDTFEDIWNRCQLFLERFWPNIEVFFSGSKGFHIYLYVYPTTMGDLREYRDRMFRVFSTWFQYLLDKKAFLSLDRICRTTLTKHAIDPDHPTLPRWKIPISPKMDVNEILREATYPDQFTNKFAVLYRRAPIPIDWKFFLQSPDQVL